MRGEFRGRSGGGVPSFWRLFPPCLERSGRHSALSGYLGRLQSPQKASPGIEQPASTSSVTLGATTTKILLLASSRATSELAR